MAGQSSMAECAQERTSCVSGLRVMAMTSPIFILLRRMYGAAASQAVSHFPRWCGMKTACGFCS